MITLRSGAGAFLYNNNNVLLIHRSKNKRLAPGVWSCVGGHMETHELNNPIETCYREIEEEAGIHRNNIHSLELLYIIIRRWQNEIRQNYVYFGKTSQTQTIETSEGSLHWIPENNLLKREYTKTFTAMLEHYVARHPQDKSIYVGVAENHNNNLQMSWTCCEDFEQ